MFHVELHSKKEPKRRKSEEQKMRNKLKEKTKGKNNVNVVYRACGLYIRSV